jgi:hypothetical protein
MSAWTRVEVLSHAGSVGFGSSLVLKERVLAVAAPGVVGSDGNTVTKASLHIYSLDTSGGAVKHCDFWRPAEGGFGAALAMQVGRNGRLTLFVSEPENSRVYAVHIRPLEQDRCSMQAIVRYFGAFDNPGDSFGAAIGATHQHLFIGAPDVQRIDENGNLISGLLHYTKFCTEGQYFSTDGANFLPYECSVCPDGQWSNGGYQSVCSSCVPVHATAGAECDFTCNSGYFGNECLVCSQAMSDAAKPPNAQWVDGLEMCDFACEESYARVGEDCVKCLVNAEDRNGSWIAQTCNWTCKKSFFATAMDTAQPDCVPCSMLQELSGAWKPDNSEWVDGLETCQFGPVVGYQCSIDNCEPCLPLVHHAHWTNLEPRLGARCDFACDAGFFGHPEYEGVCATCHDLLEEIVPPAQRPWRPARSLWRNATTTCDASTWVCMPGTHSSSTQAFCCPDVIPHSIPDADVAPCQVRCEQGFWWDEMRGTCEACFDLPDRAKWGEGNCTIEALPGFQCSDHVCEACASLLPPNAAYMESPVPCSYRCNEGFFGHPTYPGVCELCSEVMQSVVDPAHRLQLPAHAFWDNEVSTCTTSSWTCGDGFVKSSTDLYCCPNETDPNASPWASGRPCPMGCNPGYIWSDAEHGCIDCAAPPVHFDQWTEGCKFTCKEGHFGSELGKCLTCRAYQYLKEVDAPVHASWPEDAVACGPTDWQCDAGFVKRLDTLVPGCCPTQLPEGGSWNGPSENCYIKCLSGWKWDMATMTCVGCPAGSAKNEPTSGKGTYVWDSEGSCSYKCVNEDYFPYPEPPQRLQECLLCKDYAQRKWGDAPANAHWLSTKTCSEDSWECNTGFVKNGGAGLCCAKGLLPVDYEMLMHENRGGWVAGTSACAWQCNAGFFPDVAVSQGLTIPGKNCLSCKQYLQDNDIRSCYDNPNAASCKEKDIQQNPKTCSGQVNVEYTVKGALMPEEFSYSVENEFRVGIAKALSSSVSLDQIVVVFVVDKAKNRRMSTLAPSVQLVVSVEIRDVIPHMVKSVKMSLESKSTSTLNAWLQRSGVPIIVDEQIVAKVSAGSSTWTCKQPFVRNLHTGKCCQSRAGSYPAMDLTRIIWVGDCDWVCRRGFFWNKIRGECVSCAEFNEELNPQRPFKPSNSVWTFSTDCSEWKCEEGYVRSASGFSCLELKRLEQTCSKFSRCASCNAYDDCVWCNGSCQAGLQRRNSASCPYTQDGTLGACTCESAVCSQECQHSTCSSCTSDAFCGWCIASESCHLGSYFQPAVGSCPSGMWMHGSNANCASDDELWIIGLTCATGSILLVTLLGVCVVSRVRRAARLDRERAEGRAPEQLRLRQRTERVVATFPTFKFKASQGVPTGPLESTSASDPYGLAAPFDDDECDDNPMCSICLGEFGEGEDLRMLPCMHVFHVACIDQWLRLSHECPLCKRSVVEHSNSQQSAQSNPTFALAQTSLFAHGEGPGSHQGQGNGSSAVNEPESTLASAWRLRLTGVAERRAQSMSERGIQAPGANVEMAVLPGMREDVIGREHDLEVSAVDVDVEINAGPLSPFDYMDFAMSPFNYPERSDAAAPQASEHANLLRDHEPAEGRNAEAPAALSASANLNTRTPSVHSDSRPANGAAAASEGHVPPPRRLQRSDTEVPADAEVPPLTNDLNDTALTITGEHGAGAIDHLLALFGDTRPARRDSARRASNPFECSPGRVPAHGSGDIQEPDASAASTGSSTHECCLESDVRQAPGLAAVSLEEAPPQGNSAETPRSFRPDSDDQTRLQPPPGVAGSSLPTENDLCWVHSSSEASLVDVESQGVSIERSIPQAVFQVAQAPAHDVANVPVTEGNVSSPASPIEMVAAAVGAIEGSDSRVRGRSQQQGASDGDVEV